MKGPTPSHVTAQPWAAGLQHASYGTPDTYRLAAAWLKHCPTVADWGGSTGALGAYLPPTTEYTIVDGTQQTDGQVLADLVSYREPSDGIALRHVLDATWEWAKILRNAIDACRQRLVVVTCYPTAPVTGIARLKSGWPIWHFNPADLRRVMGEALVHEAAVQTSHPERIYYLARPHEDR